MKKVVIYTCRLCAHCDWAKELLSKKNVKFIEHNIEKDSSKMVEMLRKSNGVKTVPQIFIGEHRVGGNDELQTLEREGKLDNFLKN